MERRDLPTVHTSHTPPHLHQARAGTWPLPVQCVPPPPGRPSSGAGIRSRSTTITSSIPRTRGLACLPPSRILTPLPWRKSAMCGAPTPGTPSPARTSRTRCRMLCCGPGSGGTARISSLSTSPATSARSSGGNYGSGPGAGPNHPRATCRDMGLRGRHEGVTQPRDGREVEPLAN
jgi:hypothetical protein